MNLQLLFAGIFLACFGTCAYAQEARIREREISPAIKSYVKEHCNQAKRIRYFKEINNGEHCIEVEFIEDHREHSITFLNDALYETEVEIAFDDIDLPTKKKMESKLLELYTRYKIIECQQVNIESRLQFEIEVRGSKDHYFNLLFDTAGNLIEQTEISVKPIPNQF